MAGHPTRRRAWTNFPLLSLDGLGRSSSHCEFWASSHSRKIMYGPMRKLRGF